MKKIFRTVIAACMTLTLTGCFLDSNKVTIVEPPPPVAVTPTTLAVNGTVIKGIVVSGTANLYKVPDLDNVVATTQTDSEGKYSLTVTDESGEPITGAYVVTIIADEDTTMLCDAAVCGDVTRGSEIPATELQGLSLSTLTFADGETGVIDADITALTDIATSAILSAVDGNENIDLDTVDEQGIADLQNAASQVVGAILGLDLSSTNLFDLEIIDATKFTADTQLDPVASSLSILNASFSGLDGDNLVKYLGTIKNIVKLLVDPNTQGDVSTEDLATVTDTQTELALQVVDALTVVVQDTGLTIETSVVETEPNLGEISEAITKIVTGGTGD